MSRYALSKRSSSYYLKQFREDRIEIQPAREAGLYEVVRGELVKAAPGTSCAIHLDASPGAGILTIEADHSSFDLYFPCEGRKVEPRFIQIGREVLGQIVEMDTAARALQPNHEFREELAYADIRAEDMLELHYCANTANAEWGVFFQRGEDGRWVPENLPVEPSAQEH